MSAGTDGYVRTAAMTVGEGVLMTGMALTRVIGVGLIILLGIYGGLLSGSAGFDVVVVFQVVNAALLFVIMTLVRVDQPPGPVAHCSA